MADGPGTSRCRDGSVVAAVGVALVGSSPSGSPSARGRCHRRPRPVRPRRTPSCPPSDASSSSSGSATRRRCAPCVRRSPAPSSSSARRAVLGPCRAGGSAVASLRAGPRVPRACRAIAPSGMVGGDGHHDRRRGTGTSSGDSVGADSESSSRGSSRNTIGATVRYAAAAASVPVPPTDTAHQDDEGERLGAHHHRDRAAAHAQSPRHGDRPDDVERRSIADGRPEARTGIGRRRASTRRITSSTNARAATNSGRRARRRHASRLRGQALAQAMQAAMEMGADRRLRVDRSPRRSPRTTARRRSAA